MWYAVAIACIRFKNMTEHNFRKKMRKTPVFLGKGLARFQHGLDRVFSWGFKKVQTVSKPSSTDNNNVFVRALKDLGTFVGKAGGSFYDEYERLKKEKESKTKYRDAEWEEKK